MMVRTGTIDSPELPASIPGHSQWLLGQGAGVWFCIDKTAKPHQFNIKRYTPTGELDCDRIFEIEVNDSVFDIEKNYQFTHISHCAKCQIIQNNIVFVFNYV